MKDRKTIGFSMDAAESAAITMPDPRATERIIEACDWKQDWKSRRIKINNTLRRLGPDDREFARSVLRGATSKELGLLRSTFCIRLKKVEKVLRGL